MENFNTVPDKGTFGESVEVVNQNFSLAQQEMEILRNLISPDTKFVTAVATAQTTSVTQVLPETGSTDTVYRVGSWNGSQYDPSVYSEYAWNSSSYIKLNTKSQAGEVYDISANHSNTKYIDLAEALSGDNVPVGVRKGGMSVKYIQSSDNKYIQVRCMAQNFTTDVTQWQGVDNEPTAGSDNLVESSGVFNFVTKSLNKSIRLNQGTISVVTGNITNVTNGLRTDPILGGLYIRVNNGFSIYSINKYSSNEPSSTTFIENVISGNSYRQEALIEDDGTHYFVVCIERNNHGEELLIQDSGSVINSFCGGIAGSEIELNKANVERLRNIAEDYTVDNYDNKGRDVSGSIGDIAPLTLISGFVSKIIPCKPNDKFYITGKEGNLDKARGITILDSDNKIMYSSPNGSVEFNNAEVVIPNGAAYLVVNFVVNDSYPYSCKKTNCIDGLLNNIADSIHFLQDEINDLSKTKKDIELIEVTDFDFGYLATNKNVGDSFDDTDVTSTYNFVHKVFYVEKGDVFYITGNGGSAPRLWMMTDDSGLVHSVSDDGLGVTDLMIEIPDGVRKLVVNLATAFTMKVTCSNYRKFTRIAQNKIPFTTGYISSGDNVFNIKQGAVGGGTDYRIVGKVELEGYCEISINTGLKFKVCVTDKDGLGNLTKIIGQYELSSFKGVIPKGTITWIEIKDPIGKNLSSDIETKLSIICKNEITVNTPYYSCPDFNISEIPDSFIPNINVWHADGTTYLSYFADIANAHQDEVNVINLENYIDEAKPSALSGLPFNMYKIKAKEMSADMNAPCLFIVAGVHLELTGMADVALLFYSLLNVKNKYIDALRSYNIYVLPALNVWGLYNQNVEHSSRGNYNMVNLNRNFIVGGKSFSLVNNDAGYGTVKSSNGYPFSEWETRLFIEALKIVSPDVYIDNHSWMSSLVLGQQFTINNTKMKRQIAQGFVRSFNVDMCDVSREYYPNDAPSGLACMVQSSQYGAAFPSSAVVTEDATTYGYIEYQYRIPAFLIERSDRFLYVNGEPSANPTHLVDLKYVRYSTEITMRFIYYLLSKMNNLWKSK